ncbi:hypothetical protein [Marispirochaeta aestuarii]|uniref:hypothetical protein n=1 Tax=Marispirochaeta aestuarii TaxID=1963862 RepID=UPI0029C6B439|nr:hypothetical protein [Marispirochaeta aestuarii]
MKKVLPSVGVAYPDDKPDRNAVCRCEKEKKRLVSSAAKGQTLTIWSTPDPGIPGNRT